MTDGRKEPTPVPPDQVRPEPPPAPPARSRAPRALDQQLDSGTCKSCQAPILWGVTIHGRAIPLDVKPQLLFVLSHDMPRLVVQRQCLVPHHATCPNADAHRRETPTAAPQAAS